MRRKAHFQRAQNSVFSCQLLYSHLVAADRAFLQPSPSGSESGPITGTAIWYVNKNRARYLQRVV